MDQYYPLLDLLMLKPLCVFHCAITPPFDDSDLSGDSILMHKYQLEYTGGRTKLAVLWVESIDIVEQSILVLVVENKGGIHKCIANMDEASVCHIIDREC